jgi:hypothetical protein
VLTPAGKKWMRENNKVMDGGHCEGFAVLSSLMYVGKVSPQTFGADMPDQLELEDNMDLQREIAYWFTTQYTSKGTERFDMTPVQIINELAAQFKREAAGSKKFESYVVGIYKPGYEEGHAVTPYAVNELDGDKVVKCDPVIGYLHRGDEKIAENMTYNQFVPYTDRLDYLAPLANNVAYAMAVEKLMGWELPPRGQAIRVICCELARISSHLLGLGAFAMDTGAMTVFLYTFTEREKIYNLCEVISGARFTTSYTRIGGMTRDLPDSFFPQASKFLDEFLTL